MSFDEPGNPGHPLLDLGHGIGVGDPDVSLPHLPEPGPGDEDNLFFVEESGDELVARQSRLFDAREDIEGALGHEAVQPHPLQRSDDVGPPKVVGVPHLVRLLLPAFEGFQGGVLADGGRS